MRALSRLEKAAMIIIIIVASVCFLMWSINNHCNEKIFEEKYAEIFDESLQASYPLLVQASTAFYEKSKQFEFNAIEASRYSRNTDEFQEYFVQLNRKCQNSQRDYWEKEYSLFIVSLPGGRLFRGSDLRKKQSIAFRKIEWSRLMLNHWDKMDPDSLIKICHKVQVALSEAIQDIDDYRTPHQDINAWRNIGPEELYEINQEYKQRKNWPFTFLNKSHN